jgi:hypothetical protein
MRTTEITNNSPSHKKKPSITQQAAALFSNSSKSRLPSGNALSRCSSTDKPSLRLSRFEHLLESTQMPPSGPEYYAARRRLWLKPGWQDTPKARSRSSSRQKLEIVLNQSDVLNDDNAWKKIERVYKNIDGGTRLSEGLPMSLIVCLPSSVPWLACG